MPNNLPIQANVMQSYQLPAHLRRKSKVIWGIQEREQILSLINFGELEGLLSSALLEGLVNPPPEKNDLKMVAQNYELTTNLLDPVIWHIIRYDICQLLGDRTFLKSVNNEAYFQANVSGRYQVNCTTQIYFLSEGDYSMWESVQEYWDNFLLSQFLDGDYQLAIYNTDGTLIEILSVFPARVGLDNGVSISYYWNTIIPLNGSTILYLDAGEKIDFRVNLLGYAPVVSQKFRLHSVASIHFIDNNRDLI